MSTKVLQVVTANAATILQSTQFTDAVFKLWYVHAEKALLDTFGPDWQELVMWEGYNCGSSWDEDKNSLERAVHFIENAQTFLVEDDSAKAPSAPSATESETASINTDSKHPVPAARIFIVHGHDEVAKLDLKNYLQNVLKLPEPIVLHEQPNQGRTILEKFAMYADNATFAFILLTPDDKLAQEEPSGSKLYRARQNVIFEMGYFLALLGRTSGRVILLYKGTLDIPSDISGVVYIDISNGIESAGEKIRRELALYASAI